MITIRLELFEQIFKCERKAGDYYAHKHRLFEKERQILTFSQIWCYLFQVSAI